MSDYTSLTVLSKWKTALDKSKPKKSDTTAEDVIAEYEKIKEKLTTKEDDNER